MTTPASIAFWDPAGVRYGIPTFPWRQAPAHYATLRQLAARGLRPGGQGVQAQILWRSRRSRDGKPRRAYLYDVRLALPKRVPSAAQLAALAKALRARRICPRCGRDAGYTLPRRIGACLDCATEWELNAA
jgi:hypothetical protein